LPIFYYNADNLSTIVDYSELTGIRSFANIILRSFRPEVLLPLFARFDLPLKSGKPSKFQLLDVLLVLAVALNLGGREQQSFIEVRGF
jgi:hypothetical protein